MELLRGVSAANNFVLARARHWVDDANMSVHFRFTPKATVADQNVIRRMVPTSGHRPILSAKVRIHRQ